MNKDKQCPICYRKMPDLFSSTGLNVKKKIFVFLSRVECRKRRYIVLKIFFDVVVVETNIVIERLFFF